MPTIPELTAFFGLIALAISMIILNKRYDLKQVPLAGEFGFEPGGGEKR